MDLCPLAVKQPDRKIYNRGETGPEKVRDQEPSGRGGERKEQNDGPEDKEPEDEYFDQSDRYQVLAKKEIGP
jgi:hypothetical protein